MSDRSRLIATLSDSLTPVPGWRRPRGLMLFWLVAATAFVVGVSILIQPWRPSFAQQLVASPAFAAEILVAAAGLVMIATLAFRTAVPGAIRIGTATAVGLLAFLPWLVMLLVGLWYPALEPSMNGKRTACYLEVLLLGLPPMILGLVLLRRLYPLRGWPTGTLIGAASGLIPAIAMQMACMYLVPHTLTHHVLPVLVPVMAGGVLGALFLRPGRG